LKEAENGKLNKNGTNRKFEGLGKMLVKSESEYYRERSRKQGGMEWHRASVWDFDTSNALSLQLI